MKILLISRDYSPSVGGIQSHVMNLYSQYRKKGMEVFVLSRAYQNYSESDSSVYRVTNNEVRILKAIEYVVKGRRQLNALHKAHKFDVIHWHDLFFDSLLTKQPLEGAKRIFTNHSSGFLEWFEGPNKKKYLRWLMTHADVVLSPSEELNHKTMEVVSGAKCAYIPNGVDTEAFRPSKSGSRTSVREKYNFGLDDFVVLCPRRLEPKNGVKYFVESAKYFGPNERKPKYLIVGGGFSDERDKMEAFIKDNNIDNVVFAGAMPNSEMIHYYQAADAVVLPSLMEATSISGLEAMACGLPLIGTKVGGIPALVREGRNGFLIEPGDPKAIYLSVAHLMSNLDLVKSFSSESRSIAENEFSWETIANEVLSHY